MISLTVCEGSWEENISACLSLILLLGPEACLQRPPGLQERLPLLALGEVLGVGARPVDGEVDHKQRGHRVQRLCQHRPGSIRAGWGQILNILFCIFAAPTVSHLIVCNN